MINIFEYLKWRGDITFDSFPLNELDSLVFAELSYIPYDNIVSSAMRGTGISISEIYHNNFESKKEGIKIGAIFPEKQLAELIKTAAETERFKNVHIRAYVNDIDLKHEKQFSAMCFDISDDYTYVAFRGTDDTIIGWKEDLNMSLFTPIPAQKEAVDYLNAVGSISKRNLYIGGHSKGGNLAVYSAFEADRKVQKRIVSVHSFDGPGFRKEFLEKAEENLQLVEKTINFIPESALIGVIFDTIGKREYVKSYAKGGLRQHDAFTWEVDKTSLSRAESLSKSSMQFHKSLEELVAEMTEEEMTDFVDAVYKLCTANDSETLTDILSNKLKFINALFKADGKSKKTMWINVKRIFKKTFFKGHKKDNET